MRQVEELIDRYRNRIVVLSQMMHYYDSDIDKYRVYAKKTVYQNVVKELEEMLKDMRDAHA